MTAYVRPSDDLIYKRRVARRGKNFDRFHDLQWFGKGGFVSLYCLEWINAFGYQEWHMADIKWRTAYTMRRT